jgi:hypothetical protein
MNFKTDIAKDHLTQALDTLSSIEKLTLLRRHFKKQIKKSAPLSEADLTLMNAVFQEYAKLSEESNDNYPTGSSTKSMSRNLSKGSINEHHKSVLKAFNEGGSQSRTDLSIVTGLPLQSICARVNELVALGYVEVIGVKKCHKTERCVEMLFITPSGDVFMNPPKQEQEVG